MSGVVSELRGRWDSSHAGLVPMVDVSPFGVVDGRQDFRGFVASDLRGLHMFKSGEVIGNADISYGVFPRYVVSVGGAVENVVAVDAVFNRLKVIGGRIVGCRFEGVDFTDQSFFGDSVVDGCEFVGCVAPEAFGGVAAVVDSVIVDTVIQRMGDVNYEQSPLLLRSRFETKMSNVTIWVHPEAQNLQGCDFF
ncbi:hypothetical protein CMUST_00865 [Corynebacterium mustelae]|uniref:Uncharacterized protein n=1 Tax=Corynebacterium mustelae TaxID=571915 RepID=A0A0G3GTR9_9CORY|nr:hypothetical protein [Corynebacterium mustelae]AKK04524.1 hypothetical protein CMUST_00865 [Corynebacterium mustelae]